MKGLAISRRKDSFSMLPPERQMELVERAGAYIDKYRKAGKCKEFYVVAGLKMTVGIWEVESPEERDRIALENPMFPFLDMEIYTLSDWETRMKIMKEMFERLPKK